MEVLVSRLTVARGGMESIRLQTKLARHLLPVLVGAVRGRKNILKYEVFKIPLLKQLSLETNYISKVPVIKNMKIINCCRKD